ncbi:MAG: N-acetyltransferase [Desulfovibrio desulfuricans]|nr:N-acetyltransferase [Desulfovibrio desulfuricans]
MSEDAIVTRKFCEVDLSDPFFDSLKESYREFSDWFQRKSNETAYVSYDSNGKLQAFLYLKKEDGPIIDINPPLNTACLKVGTFKIIAHGTKLGERFVKIIVDATLSLGLRIAYVTIFNEHKSLIKILETYGFLKRGTKNTTNGEEDVYIKDMQYLSGDTNLDYPVVNSQNRQKWLMSIYAPYHTDLFPDSRLKTERNLVIQDCSHTNSIHKVYVGAYRDFPKFKPGDCIVIYRCVERDSKKPAWFGSVATSLCVAEEILPARDFPNSDAFVTYCKKYSVLDENNLRRRYNNFGTYALRMSYNLAFPKRPTLRELVEGRIVPHPSTRVYMGLQLLTDDKFQKIIELGGVREGFVIY